MPPPQFYPRFPNSKGDAPAQEHNSLQDSSSSSQQGSTTNISQDQSPFQSQTTGVRARDEGANTSIPSLIPSTYREGGLRLRTSGQGMATSSYHSQVTAQSNTSISQATTFEPGGVYWLKKKNINDTYEILELLNNGHRRLYNDGGRLRPVVVLRPETGEQGDVYRVAIVTTFLNKSFEQWTIERATLGVRLDLLHSIPLMKDTPTFTNPLYNGPITITDPLYLGRGQPDRLSYLRTDRTLEVPPEALEIWQSGIADTGPARLCFSSYRRLMNAVGISGGHDELFFGRKLVLRPGMSYNYPVGTLSNHTDNSTNAAMPTGTQPNPPALVNSSGNDPSPAAYDLERAPGWFFDGPEPDSHSLPSSSNEVVNTTTPVVHDQEWTPGWIAADEA